MCACVCWRGGSCGGGDGGVRGGGDVDDAVCGGGDCGCGGGGDGGGDGGARSCVRRYELWQVAGAVA